MIDPNKIFKYVVSFKIRDTGINKSVCLDSTIAPTAMSGFRVLQMLEQTFALESANFINVVCKEKL